MIKIGLHFSLYSDTGDWVNVYSSYARLSTLADKLGYDAISISEHHFTESGWCPNPMLPLASIAHITKRVKLVSGVRLLPLHGPVRVAEESAVLDVISGGRAVVGVGLGYRDVELKAFNAEVKNRGRLIEEQVRVLDLLLRGEAVSGNYAWGKLENVRVTPRPVQRPRPQIWIASKVERGVRRAARLGDAWLADPITPIHILKRLSSIYLAESRGRGDVILRVDGFLAKSSVDEEKALNSILNSYERDYYRWGHLVDKSGRPVNPSEVEFKEVLDTVLDRLVVGTRERFLDKLLSHASSVRASTVLIRLAFPGLGYREIEDCVKEISRAIRSVEKGA